MLRRNGESTSGYRAISMSPKLVWNMMRSSLRRAAQSTPVQMAAKRTNEGSKALRCMLMYDQRRKPVLDSLALTWKEGCGSIDIVARVLTALGTCRAIEVRSERNIDKRALSIRLCSYHTQDSLLYKSSSSCYVDRQRRCRRHLQRIPSDCMQASCLFWPFGKSSSTFPCNLSMDSGGTLD